MTDTRTLQVYDARAQDYLELTTGTAPDATLVAFMGLLPKDGRVLDLGCGPGRSSGHFAQAGFAVDAMDASAQMVALARDIPGVTAWQATFNDIAGVALYDGVWANFSLLHAPRDALPQHLAAIRRALKPGGVLHIAVKEGQGAARDSLGRLYTYYIEPELTALLRDAGFIPGPSQRGADTGLTGETEPWISVTARA